MRRALNVPALDATGGCPQLRMNYQTMASYNANLKPTLDTLVNSISSATGSRMEILRQSRVTTEIQEYDQKLTNLGTLENTVNETIKCLNKDMLQRNEISSRIYELQQQVEGVRKELQETKQTTETAKERANEIENPYAQTTWWQNWFPLGRPIRKESVPVLLSVSILMLVFSLGIFLRFAGMELRFESVTTSTNSFLKNLNSRKYP